ncbi:hypothetical protein FGU71_10825 [Erythrobacter insulae]|uniref:Uncharacterized protein n=1 Tax=Erythrobacter insulae TaxID=2584124 RepID=A0A547PDV3_9SPHN|nr:hypothetical protein [Erythrobacter insulae]TRD12307.1 hypothetical protein FGU71_10825 [Erythrobacter insulae]
MTTPPKARRAVPPPMAWAPPAPFDFFALTHADQWLAHVQAGRIGNRIPATPEQLEQHAHNERVLLGVRGAD